MLNFRSLRLFSGAQRARSLAISVMLILVCSLRAVSAVAAEPVQVAASIQPLGLIARELLAPVAPQGVAVIVPQSSSPHGFSLQPSDVRLVVSAPVLLWLGPDFEPYLEKALKKRPQKLQSTVITAADIDGIRLLPVREVGAAGIADHHHHHHGHHHDHGAMDPHLWWDSGNAEKIAAALTEALIGLYPQWRSKLEASLQSFTAGLEERRQTLLARRIESPAGFLNYHDSLLYLESELGISSKRRIALAPEDKPSVKDMVSIVRWLTEEDISCLIVEPGVSERFLAKINPQGVLQEIEIDPLGWDVASYSDMWFQGASRLMDCAARKDPPGK